MALSALLQRIKPMGVATFRAKEDMPEKFQKALPDIEELKKLL